MRRDTCFQFAETGTCSYGDMCKFPHVVASGFKITAMVAPAKRAIANKKGVRTRRRQRALASDTPLDDFFARYPDFDYSPRASASQEFYRLCDWFGWGKDSQVRKDAHLRFKDALVLQFNETYGTEVDSVRSWQALAEAIGIDPVPETLEECRAAVEISHVNIVDLVDARHDDSEVIVHNFATEVALSRYTMREGEYFPREHAYAGGLLRYLLRHIFNPDASRDSGMYRSRRRSGRRM